MLVRHVTRQKKTLVSEHITTLKKAAQLYCSNKRQHKPLKHRTQAAQRPILSDPPSLMSTTIRVAAAHGGGEQHCTGTTRAASSRRDKGGEHSQQADDDVTDGALCQCLGGYDLRHNPWGWLSLRIHVIRVKKHGQHVHLYAHMPFNFAQPLLVRVCSNETQVALFLREAVADMHRRIDGECVAALETHLRSLCHRGATVPLSWHDKVVDAWLALVEAYKVAVAYGAPFSTLHAASFINQLRNFADNHAFAIRSENGGTYALALRFVTAACAARCGPHDAVALAHDVHGLHDLHRAACKGLANLRRAVTRFQHTRQGVQEACGRSESSGAAAPSPTQVHPVQAASSIAPTNE